MRTPRRAASATAASVSTQQSKRQLEDGGDSAQWFQIAKNPPEIKSPEVNSINLSKQISVVSHNFLFWSFLKYVKM